MPELHDTPVHRLVEMYCNGEISAEDYYAAMEHRARDAIREEIRTCSERQARASRRRA